MRRTTETEELLLAVIGAHKEAAAVYYNGEGEISFYKKGTNREADKLGSKDVHLSGGARFVAWKEERSGWVFPLEEVFRIVF